MKYILIESRGGLGALITHLNFIYRMKNMLDVNVTLKRVIETPLEREIVNRCDFVDEWISNKKKDESGYDAGIILQYTPFVAWESENVRKNKQVQRMFSAWKKQCEELERLRYLEKPAYDANIFVYAMNNKKNVLELLDLSGALAIRKSYDFKFGRKREDIPSIYGKYITIHATDNKYSRTREWPTEHCEELLARFHKEFPGYKVIKVGMESGKMIKNVDIDLAGSLSPADFCDLLRGACLHIDTMPDYAYLRATMGGISCVLWGAMPHKVFSIPEDVNIYSDACRHWCMNVNDFWQEKCMLQDVRCLASITPEQVMKKIIKHRKRWER